MVTSKSVWAIAVLGCAVLAPATTSEQLRQNLRIPDKGSTTWTVVLTTGHFGKDPVLADQERNLALEILAELGAKGDQVIVAAGEYDLWDKKGPAPIEQLESLLPMNPGPQSKGGRDIENLLLRAAAFSKGPILILSPSGSLQVSGAPQLQGGNGQVSGFRGPFRVWHVLEGKPGRNLLVTASVPDTAFVGDAARLAWREPPVPKPGKDVKTTGAAQPGKMPSETPATQGGLDFQNLAIGAIIGAFVAALIALLLRKKDPVVADSSSAVSAIAEPQEPIVVQEAAKKESETTHLDGNKTVLTDPPRHDVDALLTQLRDLDASEKMELRQQVARREKSLEKWEQLMVDVMENLDRLQEIESDHPDKVELVGRIQNQLSRLAARVGFDVIQPNPGDPVIDGLHVITEVLVPKDGNSAGTINLLIEKGFRYGDRVIKPAHVSVFEELR